MLDEIKLSAYIARRLETGLTWRIVRIISELQILKRASYFMLIFVPILAGLWPCVRLVANQHNKAVHDLTIIMNQTYENFDEKEKKFISQLEQLNLKNNVNISESISSEINQTLSSVKNRVENIHHQVERFKDDYTPKTLKEPNLPWSWATAFFASLFVVISHLLYQAFAPEVVRNFTLEDFISNRKQDYSKHPTDTALSRAREYNDSILGEKDKDREKYELSRIIEKLINYKSDEELRSEIRNLPISSRNTLIELVGDEIEMHTPDAPSQLQHVYESLIKIRSETTKKSIDGVGIEQLTLIERGARIEYLSVAKQKTPMIFITGTIYLIGLYLLMSIIYVQSISITDTAGWTSLFNMFSM